MLGLPGCARSPARNGLDWVLERLSAGFPVTDSIVAGMGNFKEREFFQIGAPAEREVPKVSFGTTGA